MNINKPELVTRIAEKSQFTKRDSEHMLECIGEVSYETLLELPVGSKFTIPKLGIFEIIEVKEKVGRNPKNPEQEIIIPAHKKVRYRVDKNLKAELKQR